MTPRPAVEARLQTHWALQIAASASSLLPPQEDHSQTTLLWRPNLGALLGQPIAVSAGARVGLRLHDLTLLIVNGDDEAVASEQSLAGISAREGFSWVSQALKTLGAERDVLPLEHDLPFHGVSQGLLFSVGKDEQVALAAWHARSWSKLLEIAAVEKGASDVRCWPHHFNSATLITLRGASDKDGLRSIGVGMSPGDATFAEPYWYVTPWPYPDNEVTLPILAGRGRWHLQAGTREDRTAAVLPAHDEGKDPEAAVQDFLDTAIGACKTLLRTTGER